MKIESFIFNKSLDYEFIFLLTDENGTRAGSVYPQTVQNTKDWKILKKHKSEKEAVKYHEQQYNEIVKEFEQLWHTSK